MILTVAHANNHQLTWGVLGAALQGVEPFMTDNDARDAVNFDILDGDYQTRQGSIRRPGTKR